MNNSTCINFFKEKDSRELNINIINIVIIILLVFVLIINLFKICKINKLEEEVELGREKIGLEKTNNIDKLDGLEISKLKKSIELIMDNNVRDIEFKNNKIKLIGLSSDINNINNYVEIFKSDSNIQRCNIDKITNENEFYKFEINAYIGDKNNNES